eukprot:gene16255-22137_t
MNNKSESQLNEEFAQQLLANTDKIINTSFKPQVVLPGDILEVATAGKDFYEVAPIILRPNAANNTLRIGNGLKQDKDGIVSTLPGVLTYRPPNTYYIDTQSKRYYPRVGDQVIGVIEERGGDFYIMNIFSGTNCILNRLSFEGATKRNKPELRKGDIVYARVMIASRGVDTELSCLTLSGTKKEWTTGETVYGELVQGLLVHVSSVTIKTLLQPDCPVLTNLAKYFAFEVSVGMNGCVWLRGMSIMETIIIRNAILNSEILLDPLEIMVMVEKLVKIAKKHSK